MVKFVELSKIEGTKKEPSKPNETVVTFGEHSYRVSVKKNNDEHRKCSQPIPPGIEQFIENTLIKKLKDGRTVGTILKEENSLTIVHTRGVNYIQIGSESHVIDTTPLPKLSKESINSIKESQRASQRATKGIALSKEVQERLKQIEEILTKLHSIVPTDDAIKEKIQTQIDRFNEHRDKLLETQPSTASTTEAVVDTAKGTESTAQTKTTVPDVESRAQQIDFTCFDKPIQSRKGSLRESYTDIRQSYGIYQASFTKKEAFKEQIFLLKSVNNIIAESITKHKEKVEKIRTNPLKKQTLSIINDRIAILYKIKAAVTKIMMEIEISKQSENNPKKQALQDTTKTIELPKIIPELESFIKASLNTDT